MKEKIEGYISEVQQELDRLMARRQQIEQARADNEISIQRHIGAITGAQQILALVAPPAEESEPEGEPEPAVEPA